MNHKEFSEKLDAIERERGGSAPLTVRDFRVLFPAPVETGNQGDDTGTSASKSARKRSR